MYLGNFVVVWLWQHLWYHAALLSGSLHANRPRCLWQSRTDLFQPRRTEPVNKLLSQSFHLLTGCLWQSYCTIRDTHIRPLIQSDMCAITTDVDQPSRLFQPCLPCLPQLAGCPTKGIWKTFGDHLSKPFPMPNQQCQSTKRTYEFIRYICTIKCGEVTRVLGQSLLCSLNNNVYSQTSWLCCRYKRQIN